MIDACDFGTHQPRSICLWAGPVRAGLATAELEITKAGAKPVEVVRVRITAAGRNAIQA
jgi:hypothetical protein